MISTQKITSLQAQMN
jgi:hypothetical protein